MKLVTQGKYKFYVRESPLFDDEFVVSEIWDCDNYRVRKEMLKSGVVLDIGSNIGDFAIYASQFAPVIAYEPQPDNWRMLLMNLDINKDVLKHPITPINKAIGLKGEFTIDNSSGHSQVGKEGAKCQSITFDEAVKDIKQIDILKADVEGSEYDLFDNCSDENLKRIRYLTMELHSWRWGDERHQKLLDRLEKFFDYKREGYLQSTLYGKSKWTD